MYNLFRVINIAFNRCLTHTVTKKNQFSLKCKLYCGEEFETEKS